MKKNKSLQSILGFTLIAVALVLWLLPNIHEAATPPKKKKSTPSVKISKVTVSTVEQTLTFSGIISAENKAVLSFSVPARVVRKNVQPGDHVEKGQVLVTLDPNEFKNRYKAAEANLNELEVRLLQAERNKNRIEKLFNAKAATTEELEFVQSNFSAIKAAKVASIAQLEETKRILQETRLFAPFSGTITRVMIEPGEFAVPGRPIVEISGDGPLELHVEIPETVVARIPIKETVSIKLPFSSNRIIKGEIISAARAAIGSGRLYPLKIKIIEDANISAGMTAELLLPVQLEKVLTIPLEAVINPGSSHPSVLLVKSKVIEKVPVRLGPVYGGKISLEGDVSPGDDVVITGQTLLENGDLVEVML